MPLGMIEFSEDLRFPKLIRLPGFTEWMFVCKGPKSPRHISQYNVLLGLGNMQSVLGRT